MLNLKKISVVALTVSICAFAGTASAQTSSVAPKNAPTVLSAEAAPRAMPKLISTNTATRAVKRVEKAVPAQASATQLQQKITDAGVINANASEAPGKSKFIYNRTKQDTNMRVLFNEASLNAR